MFFHEHWNCLKEQGVNNMGCSIQDLIRNMHYIRQDAEAVGAGGSAEGRALALVKTKLDEAILWAQELERLQGERGE